jgi:hypothetical protein
MSSRHHLWRSEFIAPTLIVRPHASQVGVFAIAGVTSLIVILSAIRAPLFLPLLSLVSFASAALIALLAWWASSESAGDRITLWDVAGAYVFIGCAAGMLGEPEQVMELSALPAIGPYPNE